MLSLQSLVLLLAVGASAAPSAAPAQSKGNLIPVTINLGYSTYQGAQEASVKSWLGIRFAAPPIGDLRFRAPQAPLKTTTVQDAYTLKDVCVGATNIIPATTPTSEDCLTLNVFTPANATTASNLPVWFFIQGGGYSSNSDGNLNATDLINRSGGNVVFVEINYRVGAFGFLASSEIQANGNLNAGFLDQRLALQWVQTNIAQFGGNPNHVVIHGDSAGAGSVALHMISYGGVNSNLYVGGLMESIYFPTQRTVPELEYQYQQFLTLTGCNTAANPLACLRSTDSANLQAASNNAGPYPNGTAAPFFPYAPCIDGTIFKDFPQNSFNAGKFVKIPIMIGNTNDEGTYFVSDAATPADVSTYMKNQFPKLTPANLATINTLYPLMAPLPGHAAYYPSLEHAFGESTFICPGILVSADVSKYFDATKVWNYRDNIEDPAFEGAGLGVPHIEELAPIFSEPSAGPGFATVNAPIVPALKDLWTNFVRYLNPNGVPGPMNNLAKEGVPNWAPFAGPNGPQRLRLQTNQTAMEAVPADQIARCAFWASIINTTES